MRNLFQRITQKLTLINLGLIVILIFVIGGSMTFYQLDRMAKNIAKNNATEDAKRYAETLKSFRSLYTSEVVSEILSQGHTKINHDYKEAQYDSIGGAIPLPATLSMALAEKMTNSNTSVKLYSKYPFPWREDRYLSEFETRAFEKFEKNSKSEEAYYEFDNDKNMIHYAIPDKMVNMSCVNCHNTHPQTPKTGWKLGDVRGAISISRPLQTESVKASVSETFFTMFTLAVTILVILWTVLNRIRGVKKSISNINTIVQDFKIGDLPDETLEVPNNEMGEITEGINVVNNNLRNVADFATNIGEGNFQVQYEKLSDKDAIGIALVNMRDSLQKVTEDDKRRNWSVAGLAKFSDILRNHDEDLSQMGHNIMSNLIEYVEANQGALFIVNEDNADEVYLEMIACYAWGRQKFQQQKILKGEGLAGQCWQEGKPIYMTEVPDGYVNITSGLGAANPKSVLIVPLTINDQVYGVLELASFKEFEEYQQEFVQKLSENIASTLSGIRTNAKTKALLEDTQQQAEEMRAQEEEMRQNQEELQATQEELARQKQEMEEELTNLKKQLKGNTKSANGKKTEAR